METIDKRLSLQQIIILAGLLSNKIIKLDVGLGNDVEQRFDHLVVLFLGQHEICSCHVNLAASSNKIKEKYVTAGGDIAVSSEQGLLEIITHGGDTNYMYHDIVYRSNCSSVQLSECLITTTSYCLMNVRVLFYRGLSKLQNK